MELPAKLSQPWVWLDTSFLCLACAPLGVAQFCPMFLRQDHNLSQPPQHHDFITSLKCDTLSWHQKTSLVGPAKRQHRRQEQMRFETRA